MSKKKTTEISILVPLFNEDEVFHSLIERLQNVINDATFECSVYLINDGSYDKTYQMINEICEIDERFIGIHLSKNFGHQHAVAAGLTICEGTLGALIIDGDLQDPPELIHQFYKLMLDGNDVVYAVRTNRKESFAKKILYKLYYKLQKHISNYNIPIDSGDFSMISRRVINQLNIMPEKDLYYRGMRAWIGFKQVPYVYERDARFAGKSKYTFKLLFNLAYKGIFNFSDFPIQFITRLGFISVFVSLLYFGYNLYRKLIYNDIPQGFTATILAIILFSGVQLISLGVIGQYLLRIFKQVQNRPLFIIDKIVKKDDSNIENKDYFAN
jgi:glycosyltransferase involved in cell wall biosynthesis